MKQQIKRIRLRELVPGLVIGKAVITEDGKVVLSEGTVLTSSLIERLWQWGITEAFIVGEENAQALKAVAEEPASNEEEPVSGVTPSFAGHYDGAVQQLHKAFETVRYLKEVPMAAMHALVDESIRTMVEAPGSLNHLQMLKDYDDYTYQHSLNVAIIAGLLAKWAGHSDVKLKEVILAGLLHDVGKMQIPLEALNKPGKLSASEMELMKKHAARGYHLLREREDVPPGVLYAVLQHHERMDGSGYPLGVTAEKIHPCARIIAVADIYDAMTAERSYQKSSSPFDVVQLLVQEMFNKLDPELCTVFFNNARDYFVGNQVILSDGRTAEVLYIAQFVGAKPVVRTQDNEFIDLEKRKDIKITGVVRA